MKRIVIGGLVLALATAAVPVTRAQVNLLTNPGFEDRGGANTPGWWKGHWGEGGAWQWIDHAQARSGKNLAAIGCGLGTIGGTGYWGQTLARVTPGEQLNFSVWVKTETGFQGRVWLVAEFKDRADKFLLTNCSVALSGEQLDYRLLSLRTDPGPPGTAELALQIRVEGTRYSALFDDALATYVTHPDAALGRPVSAEEMAAWKEQHAGRTPKRLRTQKLGNGGWTMTLPDGTPYMPVGIDYEPLALYDGMNWPLVEKDLDLIREDGFNTLTVWATGFHCTTCTTRHLTIDEMVKLTELARDRGLYIQFYLNIDRFTDLFPRAGLADGSQHHFDIDYADPGYREFCGNYARRIAMALYPYDNVSTIVVWEEKVGLDADFASEHPRVTAFYASEAGKAGFETWLRRRHGSLKRLNALWGTKYVSFREAVDQSLSDYLKGVPRNDHRQFDILEYGQIFLVDFTKDFVAAYKDIDPAMLFQCRHFDLFGPVRALHPEYSFLDTFGINNYTLGNRGPDFSFRDEFVRTKLVAGIAGVAPYVGNFGFRAEAHDKATHGLVSSEAMKAHFGADSVAAYSFIPEMAGTSYFMYLCPGWEGPWGIVLDADRERTPIFDSFRAVHATMAAKNETIARADYAEKPRVFVFQGLDGVYDLAPKGWIEHPTLSFDLAEMNVNYGVITDNDAFDPSERMAILALFHQYDEKLDTVIVHKMATYCRRGGALVIGNAFGHMDRYLWTNRAMAKLTRQLRGLEIGELKRGTVVVSGPGFPTTTIEDTFYVEAVPDTIDDDADVLLTMKVGSLEQPALIRRRHGKGSVFYLLFNPLRQTVWAGEPGREDRTSLPITAFLIRQLGIPFDTRLGNRGFDLADGRVNIHEQLVHGFANREMVACGLYEDEYGETGELYSGGVLTDEFLSFRGRRCEERGWSVNTPVFTSIGACVASNTLSFFTLDAADVSIRKGFWAIRQRTEPCRVYSVPLPAAGSD